MKFEDNKTITVRISTWKALTDEKTKLNKKTIDEVIREKLGMKDEKERKD